VVAPNAGDRPVAEEGDGGIGLVPLADQVPGAQDLVDPVGVEASEGVFQGPGIRMDVGDQSEPHGC
jgi:hypothetical protein